MGNCLFCTCPGVSNNDASIDLNVNNNNEVNIDKNEKNINIKIELLKIIIKV